MTILNDDYIYYCWTIKDSILINNNKTIIDNTRIFTLIITFLTPVETFELKRVNKIFSNIFGNGVSFFFYGFLIILNGQYFLQY